MMPIIKRVPVQVFQLKAFCNCGNEMVHDGFDYESISTKYRIKCPACGKIELADRVYPGIEFVASESDNKDRHTLKIGKGNIIKNGTFINEK